jgi:hypothetical protein
LFRSAAHGKRPLLNLGVKSWERQSPIGELHDAVQENGVPGIVGKQARK